MEMLQIGPRAALLLALALILLSVPAAHMLRRALFTRLRRSAGRTESQADDILVAAAYRPFILWCVILAAAAAVMLMPLGERAQELLRQLLLALGVVSVAAALVDGAGAALTRSSAGRVLPGTSLTRSLLALFIYTLALLVILGTYGISITPILATLGVGGLAVALALQDTLANLFAGFYIMVSRQIRVDDYVALDSGQEGVVSDITWRATRVRTLANNTILIPNDRLAKAIVTNYHLPEKGLAVTVPMGVHYNSDLKLVEQETVAAAREVMREVAGGEPEFEPFIRFHAFADSSISFTVILRGREFTDQYLLRHEFIRRVTERYRAAKIVIPYPVRALNTVQERVTEQA